MSPKQYSLLLLCLLFFPLSNFAQKKSYLSVEVNRPITIGNTFYSNYQGVIGTEITYSHRIGNRFKTNATAGYSRSKLTDLSGVSFENPTYSNLFKGILTVSYHYQVAEHLFLAPEIGGGYALQNFQNRQDNYNKNKSGLIFRAGSKITYDIPPTLSIGVEGDYNFIYHQLKDIPNTKYNREVHAIHVGLIVTRSF